MKVGDLVQPYGRGFSTLYGPEKAVHLIIGIGGGDWDWEVWCSGNKVQSHYIWYATEEELEVISESR